MIPLYDLNPHNRTPWLTLLIIVANIGVTIWMSGQSPREQQLVALRYGVVPKRVSEVGSGKPVDAPVYEVEGRGRQERIVEVGRVNLSTESALVYLTFLTAMFLHGGWMHVLSNMWILWIFGNNIEDRLGHLMYVFYYVLGGIVATLCHWAIDPASDMPVVGASGAVATVLGGYAITYPWAKVRTLIVVGLIMFVDIPALVWLGIWFILQNVIPGLMQLGGLMRDPIAYWAHIGGFVAGIALMPLLALGASPPGTDWRKEADMLFHLEGPRPT
jgi:membrane associated rhomboid family serine protease